MKMKKIISALLVSALCLGLVFMTGCGGGNIEMPYSQYDLTEYVTLPDYDSYTTEKPDVTITDEEIDAGKIRPDAFRKIVQQFHPVVR